MGLKNLKVITVILTLSFPLLAFSSTDEQIKLNDTFKVAVNKTKKPVKQQLKQSLLGTWQGTDGMSVLVFFSSSKLEFNGDEFNYVLLPGIIRVDDEGEKVDYKYSLKGNTLTLNFPEGTQMQFQKLGQNQNNTQDNEWQNSNEENNSYNQIPQNNKKQTTTKSKANCNVVYLPAEVSGGCNIRLITPGFCEEIDLSYGKSYQFAWQTGGTFCETPFKLYIAGNPVSDDNMVMWQYSTKTGQISRTGGGYDYINAQNLAGLRSDNGIYHWVVMGWFGSHPSSQTFRIKWK